MPHEKIVTKSGVELSIRKEVVQDSVDISVQKERGEDCLLHWGVARSPGSWQTPPRTIWPEGSRPFGDTAVQTPFLGKNGADRIRLQLQRPSGFSIIAFALYFPEGDRWDNNDGRNYHIPLPGYGEGSAPPLSILKKETHPEEITYEHPHRLETGDQLAVVVTGKGGILRIRLMTELSGAAVLHWGVARRSRYEWRLPPESMRPKGTTPFQDQAVETPFFRQGEYQRVELEVPEGDAPLGISFVLKVGGRWLKDQGRNFHIPLAPPPDYGTGLGAEHEGIAREIIEKEMGAGSWTLMHRFDFCHDLLDRIPGGDAEGMALIFVWLRFSALRQLDWQRNYNTKPRELGHALDRLTAKLAHRYKKEEKDRPWVRLIMGTIGRGSDAQRVRDEVLHIMHRHHIKEVSGHFMEEWHQKLHNNTTPDDVVICESFLAFLKSDGNLDVFYNSLSEGGVTKERLESYERPIRSHPDFIPHLKDALIHDFETFLGILKEVHSGTDLGTAIHTARHLLDQEMHDLADFIWHHHEDPDMPVSLLAGKVTECRRRVLQRLKGGGNGTREFLFLDMALEDFFRVAVERNLHTDLDEGELRETVALSLQNLLLSNPHEELRFCLSHWGRLNEIPRPGREWALQAEAVLDRVQRAVGSGIDSLYRILQPKAEILGKGFHARPWTVRLFSEEVVRGRPAFILSALIRKFGPILRKQARLGSWQIVSRAEAAGEVKTVSKLSSIQEEEFERATVIVPEEVTGNEEIPRGVTAVLTPDTTDIVSHVAIRARNAHLLFATCYDPDELNRIKGMEGRFVRLSVNAGGDVVVEETAREEKRDFAKPVRMKASLFRPSFTSYALPSSAFNDRNVGGKSNNLNRLRGNLPHWVHFPPSAAVPFGVFEKVLEKEENRGSAERYRQLIREMRAQEGKGRGKLLREIRASVLELKPPSEMMPALQGVMEEEGLGRPEKWEEIWTAIGKVWASKWNERACLSRLANGIPHEDLFMAVLIQKVVEADLSFVIHTVNPFTGNRDEIYAEVVLGLGETLVGNYPGRALSFTCKKGEQSAETFTFPSKSTALHGGGLIFRSDSNGEDLSEYAGAGLYDSFMLEPARKALLDYTHEPLIWDSGFRKEVLLSIARIGEAVEEIMGVPQDIEGAHSKEGWYVVQTRPQVGLEP